MRTDQPVTSHNDLLGVVDGLLGEMGLDRRDTGGKVTFAGLDPLRPTVLKTGAASAAIAGAGAIASAILWRERIQIEKIGDSEPEPLPPSSRPLSGVRALGMTHVVAGPVVLRQLAAAGADCLNLNMPGYVEDRVFFVQSDAGVRQAQLDARDPEQRKAVYALVQDADVFVENLRPQRAAREGYAAEDLAEVRPGIICVRIKLNTVTGPWASWLGFDLSAGAFTGLYIAEGSFEQPRLPGGVNVVVDFLCGMLAAAGVQAALIRRAKAGGSYRITVTLAQVTTFEMSLGLNDKAQLLYISALGPEHQIQPPNLVTRMTPFGEFTRLGSQVEMSKTPEHWADPILVPIGSSLPEWLPKA